MKYSMAGTLVPAQVLGNCKKQNMHHREWVQQLYVLHKPYVNSETLCVSKFMKHLSSLGLEGSSNVTLLAYMVWFGSAEKKKKKNEDNSSLGSQRMLTHYNEELQFLSQNGILTKERPNPSIVFVYENAITLLSIVFTKVTLILL